ncbi:hypothetical protein ACFQBQ_13550 [Granulicella cerasi]|uniref:Uncharacterized protein n=1 Tax=Granulicella cerasi TaxID=741063 RepID=A0ABW1ZAZ8_9BACT|nr:hypothetical protein [Granulicella cerasi]
MNPFVDWQNFYVIVGGAAGALTGLQFVVMALIADMPVEAHEIETANAFATPTIVHFSAALLFAASFAMPWGGHMLAARGLWVLGGVAGLGYVGHVTQRMRRQAGYKPVFEDWCFHSLLPGAGYAAIMVSAAGLSDKARETPLFAMAFALLLLLVVGIHNAWDNVTYLVLLRHQRADAQKARQAE